MRCFPFAVLSKLEAVLLSGELMVVAANVDAMAPVSSTLSVDPANDSYVSKADINRSFVSIKVPMTSSFSTNWYEMCQSRAGMKVKGDRYLYIPYHSFSSLLCLLDALLNAFICFQTVGIQVNQLEGISINITN